MSATSDVFSQLAANDKALQQHDQVTAQQSGDAFTQLATQDTLKNVNPNAPRMSAAPAKSTLQKVKDTVASAEVPGTGVTLGEAGDRAQDFASKAGQEAALLFGGPEGGVASVLAEGGRAAKAITGAAKFSHIFDEAETAQAVEKTGKIPGLLKAAYDWAKANPVKTYLLYKIADQAGIGPSGLKKLFHLVSGGEGLGE